MDTPIHPTPGPTTPVAVAAAEVLRRLPDTTASEATRSTMLLFPVTEMEVCFKDHPPVQVMKSNPPTNTTEVKVSRRAFLLSQPTAAAVVERRHPATRPMIDTQSEPSTLQLRLARSQIPYRPT